MPRSSTSNSEADPAQEALAPSAQTPTRRRRGWGGLALCLLLLAGAEAGTRGLESTGFFPPPASLDGMVMDRLDRMGAQPMHADLWLLGNSTLAEGIDEDAFTQAVGTRSWKLPHGSATAMSSIDLAGYYLHQLDAPRRIVLLTTVDDYNRNGVRAERSQKYVDFAPKPLSFFRKHVHLISNGTRLRQFFSSTGASFARGRFKLQPPVRLGTGVYDGKPIPKNSKGHNRQFRDFDPDFSFMPDLVALTAQHGMEPPLLVLLPITDQHIAFRNRLRPDWSYPAFRADLAAAATAAGLPLLDLGDTRTDYENFRDPYHANDAGKVLLTEQVARHVRSLLPPAPATPAGE